MLGSKSKSERRKYQRIDIECPVKIILENGCEYSEITEEMSYVGFHFHCDLEKATNISPDGLNNMSRANPVSCIVELLPEERDVISLQAQVESMSRLSQNEFKVLINFEDATLNLEEYQKFKGFIETYVSH